MKKAALPGEVQWEARRALALVDLVADGTQVTSRVRERPLVHITIPLADLEAAKGGTIDGRPLPTPRCGACCATGRSSASPSTSTAARWRWGARCGCRRPGSSGRSTCGMGGCAPTRGAGARRRRPITSCTGWMAGARRSRSSPACAATTTGPTTGAGSTSTSTRPTAKCGSPAPAAVSSSPGRPPLALSPRRSRSRRAPSRPGGTAARCGSPSSPRRGGSAPLPPGCGSPRPTRPRLRRLGSPPPSGAGSSTRGTCRSPRPLNLITITPNLAAGGSLVTIELTTHPLRLTTTLTAIGLTIVHADLPDSPGGDDG